MVRPESAAPFATKLLDGNSRCHAECCHGGVDVGLHRLGRRDVGMAIPKFGDTAPVGRLYG
jgi:hypothetical protein